MSSSGKKYACQESKFLTTLGTTIYVASRAEKTKDCSDTFCGEIGSFANPSPCLGEAFDLAESKSAGKDIKFAIEILTKDIVGSEDTSAVVIPTFVESITGVESGTNVTGLDELICQYTTCIQNLRAPTTQLTVMPKATGAMEANVKKQISISVGSSQFSALLADIASDTVAQLILNDVKLVLQTTNILAGDRSNFKLDWSGGDWMGPNSTDNGPIITVGKDANVTFKTDGVDAELQGLDIDNTQGGNLNFSRKNGNWDYTGNGETVLTGCVECKKANECKNPDLSNKDCPCKKPCKVGLTTLSDENMTYTAPGTIRNFVGENFEQIMTDTFFKKNNILPGHPLIAVNVGGSFKETLRRVKFETEAVSEGLTTNLKNQSVETWFDLKLGEGTKATRSWKDVTVTAPTKKRKLYLSSKATMNSTEQGVNYGDGGQDAQLDLISLLDSRQVDVEEGNGGLYSNTWSVGEYATLSRRKRSHRAHTNGKNPLDDYNLAPRATFSVFDNEGIYDFFADGARATVPLPLLTSVRATDAKFSQTITGTQVNASYPDAGADNQNDVFPQYLTHINANGNTIIECRENNVRKILNGVSDLKATYADDTQASHIKKLCEELFRGQVTLLNHISVSDKAKSTHVLFGNQSAIKRYGIDEIKTDVPVSSTYLSVKTNNKASASIEGATNSIEMLKHDKVLDLYGSGITAVLEGGVLSGGITMMEPQTEAKTLDDVALSSLQVNGVKHTGDTMVSGQVAAIFSSGSTEGHVDARDGATLHFRSHAHSGPDSSRPLITVDNAREIKKSVYTARLQTRQSAIKAVGEKHLTVEKDLVKLNVEEDYIAPAYDYKEHQGLTDIACGNLNSGKVKRVIEGNPVNKLKLSLAPSGTFLKEAAIKDVIVDELKTAPTELNINLKNIF